MVTLVIGNKRYSSWSIRPWFFMKHAAIPFREVVIPLYQSETASHIAQWSDAGLVPVLVLEDGTRIGDSLAIGEALADRFPDAHVWPADARLRAIVRSACAEMHSGFSTMRRVLTHNVMRRYTPSSWRTIASTDEAIAQGERDLSRIRTLLASLLATSSGPFLGGSEFGFVDAFFVPVISRFTTYGIEASEALEPYFARITSLPTYMLWRSEASQETWRLPQWEYPLPDATQA